MKAHMRCSHTSVREKLRWVHISLACLATYTVGGRRLVSWDQKQTLLIYLNRHRQTHSWDQKRAFGWSHIGTSWCPIECTVRHHPFHKSLNRMRVLQSEVSQRQHTKAREEVSDQGSKNREEKQARFYRTSDCAEFVTRHHRQEMHGEMLAVRTGCQVWEFGRLTV